MGDRQDAGPAEDTIKKLPENSGTSAGIMMDMEAVAPSPPLHVSWRTAGAY
jgi:hypothetical protein